MTELALLADTAGIDVVGQTYQRAKQINPKTFIGKGKLQQVIDEVRYLDANLVIFDDE